MTDGRARNANSYWRRGRGHDELGKFLRRCSRDPDINATRDQVPTQSSLQNHAAAVLQGYTHANIPICKRVKGTTPTIVTLDSIRAFSVSPSGRKKPGRESGRVPFARLFDRLPPQIAFAFVNCQERGEGRRPR